MDFFLGLIFIIRISKLNYCYSTIDGPRGSPHPHPVRRNRYLVDNTRSPSRSPRRPPQIDISRHEDDINITSCNVYYYYHGAR